MENPATGKIDFFQSGIRGLRGLGINSLGDVQGPVVAVEQEVLLVFDVVVERSLGYIEAFGNFIQRGTIEAFAVEVPGACFEESLLLQAVLFGTVKTLLSIIMLVSIGDGTVGVAARFAV